MFAIARRFVLKHRSILCGVSPLTLYKRPFQFRSIRTKIGDVIKIDAQDVVFREQMLKCYILAKELKENNAWEIDDSKPLIVVGPKGSGKSTLLRVVADMCERDGWIILQMPNGQEWTEGIKTREDAAMHLIRHLVAEFERLEDKYKSSPEISGTFSKWLKKIDNLMAENKEPGKICLQIMSEVKDCTEFPLLLVFDDVQALFKYFTPKHAYNVIYPYHEALLHNHHYKKAQVLVACDQTYESLRYYYNLLTMNPDCVRTVEMNAFSEEELSVYLINKNSNLNKEQVKSVTGGFPSDVSALHDQYHSDIDQYIRETRKDKDQILQKLETTPNGHAFEFITESMVTQWEKGSQNPDIVNRRLFNYSTSKSYFYNNLFDAIVPGQPQYTGGLVDSILLDHAFMYRLPSISLSQARHYYFRNPVSYDALLQDLADHLYGMRFNMMSRRTKGILQIVESDNKPKTVEARQFALRRELLYRFIEIHARVSLPPPPEINMDMIVFLMNNISSASLPAGTSLEEVMAQTLSDPDKLALALDNPSENIKKQQQQEEAEIRLHHLKWMMNLNQPKPLRNITIRDPQNITSNVENIRISSEQDTVKLYEYDDMNPQTAANILGKVESNETVVHVLVPKYREKSNVQQKQQQQEEEEEKDDKQVKENTSTIQNIEELITMLEEKKKQREDEKLAEKLPKKSLEDLLLDIDKKYATPENEVASGYDLIVVPSNSREVILFKIINLNAPGVLKLKLFSPDLHVPEGMTKRVVFLTTKRTPGEIRYNRIHPEFIDGKEEEPKFSISVMIDYFGDDLRNIDSYCEHLEIQKKKRSIETDVEQFNKTVVEMMMSRTIDN
jgi:energy-coupling factor transporter ATP-binding protein EcfA2